MPKVNINLRIEIEAVNNVPLTEEMIKDKRFGNSLKIMATKIAIELERHLIKKKIEAKVTYELNN